MYMNLKCIENDLECLDSKWIKWPIRIGRLDGFRYQDRSYKIEMLDSKWIKWPIRIGLKATGLDGFRYQDRS